jgi:hypothetical protein
MAVRAKSILLAGSILLSFGLTPRRAQGED